MKSIVATLCSQGRVNVYKVLILRRYGPTGASLQWALKLAGKGRVK